MYERKVRIMAENNSLKITYKIFLEADDINENRIISSTAFVKNLFANCENTYFKNVEIDDESDLEDVSLRLYVDHSINEIKCCSPEDADTFIMDMAQFLDCIAQTQCYMDMEGSFCIEYKGKKEAFQFISEGGQDFCDFSEQ